MAISLAPLGSPRQCFLKAMIVSRLTYDTFACPAKQLYEQLCVHNSGTVHYDIDLPIRLFKLPSATTDAITPSRKRENREIIAALAANHDPITFCAFAATTLAF